MIGCSHSIVYMVWAMKGRGLVSSVKNMGRSRSVGDNCQRVCGYGVWYNMVCMLADRIECLMLIPTHTGSCIVVNAEVGAFHCTLYSAAQKSKLLYHQSPTLSQPASEVQPD